jgi:hypothetical protein
MQFYEKPASESWAGMEESPPPCGAFFRFKVRRNDYHGIRLGRRRGTGRMDSTQRRRPRRFVDSPQWRQLPFSHYAVYSWTR